VIYPFNTLNGSPRPAPAPPFAVANRLWVGALPADPVTAPQDTLRPPGLVIDPRAYGVRGPTDVASARLTWAPGTRVEASYQFAFLQAEVRGRGSPSPNPLQPVVLPFPPFTNFGTVFDESGTDSRYRGFNNELKFTFLGNERWNGFVGFSWSRTTDIASNATSSAPVNSLTEPDDSVYLFPVGPGLPFPGNFFQRTGFLERKEDIWSAYAFAEFRLSPEFILTLEGRYTIEDQLATDFLTREPTNPTIQALKPPRFQQSFDYFTPRITASWKATPDNLLYASVARGVKSGNLNGNVPFAPQRSYNSETNWTYEIGSKNRWGGLTLNLAAFHTDWKDLQVSVVRLNADGSVPPLFQIVPSTVGNVGAVSVWGVEGEFSWQVSPEFQLFAGAAWNRSRYKDGSVSQRFGASGNCDGVVCAPVAGVPTAVLPLGGNRLERVPEFDGVAGASFATDLANGWGFRARADVTHKGKQFMDEANLAFVRSRTLVNGSIGVSAGPVDLTLWARNLFDHKYVSTSLVLIGTNGAQSATYVPTFGERRTVGLTASVGF
ncbi:MAG: TonB-dependent receptor, partial [Thermaurantiacus sp.]